VQTLVPIAANARKPKMTNAAPRIFLQKGRFAVVRCAIHQGHQCGQSVNSLRPREWLLSVS